MSTYLNMWGNLICRLSIILKMVTLGTILRNDFEFGPSVQDEVLLKIFLIYSSGSTLVPKGKTIYAILVEEIMRNNYVKIF